MNSGALDYTTSISRSTGTSAGGSLLHKTLGIIIVSGALYIGGTAGTGVSAEVVPQSITRTSSGYELPNGKSTGAALMELRRLSGMTWDQLARLFEVSRRTLHFWASGKSLNAGNEEKLYRVLSSIREIDRGTAQANRTALFTPQAGGIVPFDLLQDGQYADVSSMLRDGSQQTRWVRPPYSQDSLGSQLLPKPAVLAIARHESIHRDLGKQRKVKSVRITRITNGDKA
jgi:DNA-binding transcriptional regulator YiaG